jgi:CheY-like chemotaxis protein
MKKAGFPVSVHPASDGEEAIGLLTRPPNRLFLVLSDVHLPRKSGWDVLAWVRHQPSTLHLPVVLWTSLPECDGERKAKEMGATSYLSKPNTVDDYRGVLSLIENHLSISS